MGLLWIGYLHSISFIALQDLTLASFIFILQYVSSQDTYCIHNIIINRNTSYFLYGLPSILRGLPLGRLSIIIPKVSIIRLKNLSDLIDFLLKVIELLS
jgi:hypothetical protein